MIKIFIGYKLFQSLKGLKVLKDVFGFFQSFKRIFGNCLKVVKGKSWPF